ncbi:RNA polymerase sigma factor [Denitrobaculum tricleocarpae]|uniref:RNA polymerase sigma factor n=2 Tax=Denitrobaculum tricleocarpae TaxID=2591009 RepID=A0A545U355_9PROT|nr:RNA polymerase sigma factor [Denitrobaculum tricleocarpae]
MVAMLPRLRRFAYALTGSTDLGDDLVQAACERALSRLDQWQKGTRLDSWMFRIMQTIWIDQMRAKKVRGHKIDLETAGDVAGEDGERAMEARLTLKRVRSAVEELPEEQRLVLTLVSIDGRSYKEAAQILDVPVGTITSRLARARRRLYEVAYETTANIAPIPSLEPNNG